MNNLSIIIPTYNEEENLRNLTNRIHNTLSSQNIKYEIIFVDDNSTDHTRDIIAALSSEFPVRGYLKKGRKGKAFSLNLGLSIAKYDTLCMIDADLQYPPEAIPRMIAGLNKADIIVANRKIYKTNFLRKFISYGFRNVFGKLITGLSTDVQSGLKIFKKEVWSDINYVPTAEWTFDMEFLYKAKALGFRIANFDITFNGRERGESKVDFLKAIWEIGINAILIRFKPISPHLVAPLSVSSMEGAGIRYKRKKYVTHTTLHHYTSALKTFHIDQQIILLFLGLWLCIGLYFNALQTLLVIIAILSFIYFVDVLFNLYLVWKSLNYSKEITFTEDELASLDTNNLPVYSILCPLYKEANVIPQFVNSISQLDWPKDKLDVILLLEEDDKETLTAVAGMSLPYYIRAVVVPDSQPKTKPKACNYGLSKARGEYLVIYDAEDMPDPLQLKKAYLGFQKAGKRVVCLQAKLNYYNPNHNLLTRLFTAEYSLWFDVSLTGLQSLNTSLPLGGTSNHFRLKDLHKLQGWDPFNVTEDADLGVRLFRNGYKTAIFDSTTLEEANSNLGNWLRQRSRWIKGYMQTYLVHTRDLFLFSKNQGIHSLYFNLTIGGKIAFILINPFLWLATISYFALHSYVGPTIEYLYPSFVFYMAGTSLIFGNFLFLYYYMIGAVKKQQYGLIKYIFLVPVYWIFISIAGYIAFFQLLFKPHYWEKTVHGFHLGNANNLNNMSARIIRPWTEEVAIPIGVETKPGLSAREAGFAPLPVHPVQAEVARNNSLRDRLAAFITSKKYYFSGSVLILSLFLGNVLNFLFNAYLGREVSYETFGLVSLINSFLYFTTILFIALGHTVNNRSGFLEKRYGKDTSYSFMAGLRKGLIFISIVTAVLWLLSSPFLAGYFKTEDLLPMLLFTPILLAGFAFNANKGFLTGKLMFISTAVLFLFEPLLKLGAAVLLVSLGQPELTYAAIPLSVLGGFFVSLIFVSRLKPAKLASPTLPRVLKFPRKFFFIAILSGLSTMAFLSLDVVLAKHYLSPLEAGQYALVSLVGKMIFFLATLFTVFIIPLVSRNDGAKKDTSHILWYSLLGSALLAGIGFIAIGLFGNITVPFLFGEKTLSIIPNLQPIALAVTCFSLSSVFVLYYLAKKTYTFSIVTFVLALVQIALIGKFHDSIHTLVFVMLFIGSANLFVVTVLHLFINAVTAIESNIKDLFGIFTDSTGYLDPEKKLRILIFNWRDLRHKWAGGAEVYIHEIAKRWVKDGNSVTIFCGNDGHSPRYQVINGVQIVRRGGFYTVYFWAFMYYMLKFREKFDIIVDSENGIPFLTPLYVKKPIFLLIHHVHQEVFRNHLSFSLSIIASVIEGKIMPFIYKKNTIITVSESSKKDIIELGFSKINAIHVVNPGIENDIFYKTDKAEMPTVIYLGRIKPYKNIDILIKAFGNVVTFEPTARLLIAGDGESRNNIAKLVEKLELGSHVQFLGKVTDEEKIKLLGSSWVAVQPSQIEGWGITVIEANACETPVIASNVNGLKDSIIDGKTGILVNPGNIEKFSQAIYTVLKDTELRNNLSHQALLWSHKFSWDDSAKQFYEIMLNAQSSRIDFKTSEGFSWHKIELT